MAIDHLNTMSAEDPTTTMEDATPSMVSCSNGVSSSISCTIGVLDDMFSVMAPSESQIAGMSSISSQIIGMTAIPSQIAGMNFHSLQIAGITSIPSQIVVLNTMPSQITRMLNQSYFAGLSGMPSISSMEIRFPRTIHVESVPSPIYHSSLISSPNVMPTQFFKMPSVSGGQAVTMTTLFGNSLTQSLSIKLELDNYLLWKSLVLHLFRGNGLDGIVLGTIPCPTLLDPITGASNPDTTGGF
ncbi:hypothetical protein Syun_014751 [Stephania yunnanensis]|uniref:Retrotransposon Copia-like N-terminal domain-containing protein n=1 Tax=Stephania yunnanensis TaxID=152371 RepID=A0AAP0JL00_9MAGN